MRKVFSIILLLLIPDTILLSQDDGRTHYLFTTGILNPKSPEASGMVQYGNTPGSNLYTGTMSLSIPVYTYSDLDFEVPISLDYASSGFRPNMSSGVLGEGWTLNAGGAVTREIVGIMDDATGDLELYNYQTKYYGSQDMRSELPVHQVFGYLYYSMRTDLDAYDTMQDYVYVGKAGEEYMPVLYERGTDKAYEEEPDVFSFSAPGQSGSFAFRPSGKALFYGTAYGAGTYWLEYKISSLYKNLESLTVHTGDHYSYVFGYAEMSHNVSSDGSDIGIETPCGWRLTRIEAPNGRAVNFKYGETYVSETQMPVSAHDSQQKLSNNGEVDVTEEAMSVSRDFLSMTDVTCGCLTEISTSDGSFRALFSYSRRSYEPGSGYGGGRKKLDRIDIVNADGDTVRTCRLAYRDSGAKSGSAYSAKAGVRTFLDRAHISGVGEYDMAYIKDDDIPALNTWGIDWYGYWRLGTTMADFVPAGLTTSDSALTRFRQPDTSAVKYGLLRELRYPTGGRAEFSYGPNRYGKDLTGVDSNPRNTITSGVRIEKICTYDSDGELQQTRTFRYINADGTPSGRLLWRPIVWCGYHGTSTGFNRIQRRCVSTADDFMFSGKPFIEYRRVEERTWKPREEKSAGLTVRTFLSAHHAYGREEQSGMKWTIGTDDPFECTLSPDGHTEELQLRAMSGGQSSFRGLPDTVAIYSGTGILRMSTTWYGQCTVDENICRQPLMGGEVKHFQKYHYPYVQKRTETWHDGTGLSKCDTTSYEIDHLYRPETIRTRDSAGRPVETKYSYQAEVPAYIASSETYRGGHLADRTEYLMKCLRDSLYVPDAFRTAVIGSSITKPEDITEYVTAMSFGDYDTLGRLCLMTDRYGVETDVTWDGQNPSEISTKAGAGKWLTTRYGWKPLVGMTEMSDPSGRMVRYGYDGAGRLVGTEDQTGNVILINNYNVITDREAVQ